MPELPGASEFSERIHPCAILFTETKRL